MRPTCRSRTEEAAGENLAVLLITTVVIPVIAFTFELLLLVVLFLSELPPASPLPR